MEQAPEGGERTRPVDVDCDPSVAASRLVLFIVSMFLGLTPQANHLPPLRGSDIGVGNGCGIGIGIGRGNGLSPPIPASP